MIRQLIYREPDLAKTLAQQEIKFRQNLVHAREASNMSIADVAEKLGCTPAWVTEIEDLTVQPTLAQLRAYMLAINVYATFHLHV